MPITGYSRMFVCNTADTNEGVTSKSDVSDDHTDVMPKNKPDMNADSYSDSDTPLHDAACNGHTEVVKILPEKKADVNARKRTDDAGTPLHTAAWNGHLEVVKMLLEKKADVNARKQSDGATPLFTADVNASLDDGGDTPLHTAAWNGHLEVVKILLEKKLM